MRYSTPIPTTPEAIQQIAEGIIFAKSRRTQRGLRSFKRMLALNERKLKPVVNEWLKLMGDTLRAGLSRMKGRTAAQKAKSITDWDKLKTEGIELMKLPLFEILTAGGNSVVGVKTVRKQEKRFDPIGVEAVAWANKYSAELVVEVTNETQKAIGSYIARGIDEGKSGPAIARELRPLVGLTEKQINAVANYHEMLILDRPEYTAVRQREMAEVYARRLHRDRAALIARTETRNALWEGVFEGYDQMDIKNVEGVSDPDACEWCQENINGQVMTIDEARALDVHPGCECAWVMAT